VATTSLDHDLEAWLEADCGADVCGDGCLRGDALRMFGQVSAPALIAVRVPIDDRGTLDRADEIILGDGRVCCRRRDAAEEVDLLRRLAPQLLTLASVPGVLVRLRISIFRLPSSPPSALISSAASTDPCTGLAESTRPGREEGHVAGP